MKKSAHTSAIPPLHLHRRRFTIILVVGLLAIFLYMISELLLGVIGGLLLWAMTQPLFRRLVKWTKGRTTLAASLSLVATVLFLIVPAAIVLFFMAADAANLAQSAGKWLEPYRPVIEQKLSEIGAAGKIDIFGYELQVTDLTAKLQEITGTLANFLLQVLQKTAGGIASSLLLVFIMLYTLFFCYLDGPDFLTWLKKIIPLSPEQSDRLLSDFFATSITTLKTLGIIGFVQGSMGGIAFWICGIPSPFFWTVLMALASIIPSVGAQIILVPASILLMLIGKFWWGFGLLLWSLIFIANVDNLLRPYLVKRAINLHELVVFLSTIGGITVFGFFGFLIGPVIAALLKASLQIYSDMFKLNRLPETSIPSE
ncbi:AI-2E family transporter [bacterium]|nr:AI-2E family transporter [bacterium]